MNDLTNLLKLKKGYLISLFFQLDYAMLLSTFSPTFLSNRSFKKIAKDLLSLELNSVRSLNETYSKYDGK
ncbi:hypothetical protein MTsPCn9_35520 [Croceitalea sp. MTPC9]|nr:hypothetical protein MTsPCn6_35580 [Croceitalea sp. MTPC6]GMN18608.1 hypothetical protein MTsPCn9_35520 [Croceitalea sp. MTPC9]